jgi:competence protein ComEA
MKQIAYVLIGILVGFILAGSVFIVTRLPAGKAITLAPPPTKAPIEVQVIGGVVRPGVYELPQGSRVQDAVDAAGGLLADTDASAINLVAKVDDGEQVVIPGGGGSSSAAPPGGAPFSVVPTVGSPTSPADLININTATAAQLDTLPGIGPTTAQNIVDYRNQNGPFSQIEDIMNVPGIGPATFDVIKDLISVVTP